MPWFLVDDDFAFHPKADAAGDAAIGLWTRAGSYCMKYLTEGFVSSDALRKLGGRRAQVDALVRSGLWIEVQGGHQFHQWSDRQATKAKVLADRAAAAERQKRAREKAKAAESGDSEIDENSAEMLQENTVSAGPETNESNDIPAGHADPSRRDSHRMSRPPRPGQALTTKSTHLLTLISRLAARNAQGPPPAEVIAAWQEHAGPHVDLDREAAAYLMRHGDRPAKDERGAWLGWLKAARRRAEQITRKADCTHPGCIGGWLPDDHDARPVPCPTCRPHLRPVATEEAS